VPAPSPRRRGSAASLVSGILGTVVVVAVVAVGLVWVVQATDGGVDALVAPNAESIDPPEVDQWTDYPGSAWMDSTDVLAAPSAEAVVTTAKGFTSAFRDELTQQLGFTWRKIGAEYDAAGGNGYDGQSMLHDYRTAEWQGYAPTDDPGARARIEGLFSELARTSGYDDVWRANDLYEDEEASARSEFGGPSLDEQPLWRTYAEPSTGGDIDAVLRTLDLDVPADPSFDGEVWFDLEDVPDGSIVVTVSVTSYGLLAEADRAEFAQRLGAYDESQKPDPR
jgi:hypothetical protein